MLSFSSSILQGITAISVVTGATWIFNYSMRTTQLLIDDVELGSFVLIAAAGCLIIGLRLKNISSRLRRRQAADAHIISDDTHAGGHAPLPAASLNGKAFSVSTFFRLCFQPSFVHAPGQLLCCSPIHWIYSRQACFLFWRCH